MGSGWLKVGLCKNVWRVCKGHKMTMLNVVPDERMALGCWNERIIGLICNGHEMTI